MTLLTDCRDTAAARTYAEEVFAAAGHERCSETYADAFFHEHALALLAVLAHAAALDGSATLGDIVDWSHDPDHERPLAVLRQFYGLESSWPVEVSHLAYLRETDNRTRSRAYGELTAVLTLRA